jgi:hypothetical protein
LALQSSVPSALFAFSLLGRGTLEFARLFPGFEAFARARGTEIRDQAWDIAVLTPSGWASRYHSHLRSIAASRALIEAAVRDGVQASQRNQAFHARHLTLDLSRAQK